MYYINIALLLLLVSISLIFVVHFFCFFVSILKNLSNNIFLRLNRFSLKEIHFIDNEYFIFETKETGMLLGTTYPMKMLL